MLPYEHSQNIKQSSPSWSNKFCFYIVAVFFPMISYRFSSKYAMVNSDGTFTDTNSGIKKYYIQSKKSSL